MGNEHYKNLSLANIVGEEWRDIKDFEGYYQVSNMGRVKSLERKVIFKNMNGTYRIFPEKILKQPFNGHQLRAILSSNSKLKNFITSRLVYNAFAKLEQGKFVLHKNYIVTDNRIENLCLGSHDELSTPISRKNKKDKLIKYKGVFRRKKENKLRLSKGKKYVTIIDIDKKQIRKQFKTELEAAKKYDYYVKKYKLNRELNFPDEK